jgi:hypothetical protein
MSTVDMSAAVAIDQALRAAIRAPSPHNTQPWRFETGPRHVDVLLDRDRLLDVADPDARQARLSCGAALLNLRLALQAAGQRTRYDLIPDRDQPNLLATVHLMGTRPPNPAEHGLAGAIERRASHRRPFAERPVPTRLRAGLVRAAALEEGRLVLLESPAELSAFITLLRRAHHLQEADPRFQAELRKWTATQPDRADGVPASAGGPRPVSGSVLVLRDYGSHESIAERPFEQDPLIAVLTTARDTALDQLRGGQAMQRVLLTATVEGLSASFLSQPMEVPATRAGLRELTGGRYPQTVLRLGYGYTIPHTPRRRVEAVTGTSPEVRS